MLRFSYKNKTKIVSNFYSVFLETKMKNRFYPLFLNLHFKVSLSVFGKKFHLSNICLKHEPKMSWFMFLYLLYFSYLLWHETHSSDEDNGILMS